MAETVRPGSDEDDARGRRRPLRRDGARDALAVGQADVSDGRVDRARRRPQRRVDIGGGVRDPSVRVDQLAGVKVRRLARRPGSDTAGPRRVRIDHRRRTAVRRPSPEAYGGVSARRMAGVRLFGLRVSLRRLCRSSVIPRCTRCAPGTPSPSIVAKGRGRRHLPRVCPRPAWPCRWRAPPCAWRGRAAAGSPGPCVDWGLVGGAPCRSFCFRPFPLRGSRRPSERPHRARRHGSPCRPWSVNGSIRTTGPREAAMATFFCRSP